jgi:hypothetical protein
VSRSSRGGGGKQITTATPEAFLEGLQWAYRGALLVAGPVKEERMKKKKTTTKPNSIAIAQRRIIAIATGKGPAERIAADAKRPAKFSRDDGVHFDPSWQDEVANPPPRKRPARRRSLETGKS